MPEDIERDIPPGGAPGLRRVISLPMMTAYGVGVTVGAGIYVLAGAVIGVAGAWAPVSFLLAALLATFAALSFAELSGRLPYSAGEAAYVAHGLRLPGLGTVVGLLVALAGIVSAATIVTGFAGYLRVLADLPAVAIVVATVVVLAVVAGWGIRQAVAIAAVFTIVEVAGLLLVVWAGRDAFAGIGGWARDLSAGFEPGMAVAVASGAVLAFFAFIGFEDMVNLAEEVRDVGRTMWRAVVLTMAITTVLYVAVLFVAILAVPPGLVAASAAPLAEVYARASGRSPTPVVLIGSLAIVNGALIQLVMGSRVLYGMAAQGRLPAGLARIHPRTRTPLRATALVAALIVLFALALPLETLARLASFVVLCIFALVCLALVAIKRRGEPQVAGGLVLPIAIPVAGSLVSLGFAAFQVADFLARR